MVVVWHCGSGGIVVVVACGWHCGGIVALW